MRKSEHSIPHTIDANNRKLLEITDLTKVFTKGQGLVRSTILAVNKVSFSLEREKPWRVRVVAANPLWPS